MNRVAAMMQSLGVKKGDRVIIYMPMIPEAVFAILACARIGAIHSVVFGGFAAASLAARIDDAKPALMITADGGSRMGKVVLYKSLVDESIKLAKHPPREGAALLAAAWIRSMPLVAGPRRRLEGARGRSISDAKVHCAWLESNEPSYILYTSGTTGQPKGVQRDVGGYAVALAASMKHIFCGEAGRDHVHHLGHRLGGGAFVHHLRAAHRRHDDHPVRGRADPARRRHLVEDRAGPQGGGDVLGADRDPRAEEARPGAT